MEKAKSVTVGQPDRRGAGGRSEGGGDGGSGHGWRGVGRADGLTLDALWSGEMRDDRSEPSGAHNLLNVDRSATSCGPPTYREGRG